MHSQPQEPDTQQGTAGKVNILPLHLSKISLYLHVVRCFQQIRSINQHIICLHARVDHLQGKLLAWEMIEGRA